jgi:diguanylate cyclase (GGDEF)-like protein
MPFEYDILDEKTLQPLYPTIEPGGFEYDIVDDETFEPLKTTPITEPYQAPSGAIEQKFYAEQPTTTAVQDIPYEPSTEVDPQYFEAEKLLQIEKSPYKRAEALKNIPENEREKIIQNLPVDEQVNIREKIEMFEREHPVLGAMTKAVGAGIKEISKAGMPGVGKPDPESDVQKQLKKNFDRFGLTVDQFRNEDGKIDITKIEDLPPLLNENATKNRRFAITNYLAPLEVWEKKGPKVEKTQEKIKKAGEHIVGFGEYLDPFDIKKYRIEERIQKLKDEGNEYAEAWERGDLSFVISQVIADAAITDDKERAKEAIKIRNQYRKAVSEKPEKQKGMIKNLAISTLEMLSPMAKTGVKMAIPVVGKVWAGYDWARQGMGDVYADMIDAGVSHETARGISAVSGIAYAAVEQVQFGQITRLAGNVTRDIAGKNIKKVLLNILKEKGKDYFKEVGEEGIQRFITDVGTEIGKRVDDVSEKNMAEFLKETAGNVIEEMGHAAGPMGLLTFLGISGAVAKTGAEGGFREEKGGEPVVPPVVPPPETPLEGLAFASAAAEAMAGQEATAERLKPEMELAERVKSEQVEKGVGYDIVEDVDPPSAVAPKIDAMAGLKKIEVSEKDKNVIMSSLDEVYKEEGIEEEERKVKVKEAFEGLTDESIKAFTKYNKDIEGLKKKLYVDNLTGLKTRQWAVDKGYFKKEEGGERFSPVDRNQVMIDIDDFKKVNDTYGHRVGDEVLGIFGDILNQEMEGAGEVIRYGGEEIVIFSLTGVKNNDIIKRLQRTRELFGEHVFADGELSGVNFSAGVGKDYAEADQALYKVKKSGEKGRTLEFGVGYEEKGVKPAEPDTEDIKRLRKADKGKITPSVAKGERREKKPTGEIGVSAAASAAAEAMAGQESGAMAGLEAKKKISYKPLIFKSTRYIGATKQPNFTNEFLDLSREDKYDALTEEKRNIDKNIAARKEVNASYSGLEILKNRLSRYQRNLDVGVLRIGERRVKSEKKYFSTGVPTNIDTRNTQEQVVRLLKKIGDDTKKINEWLDKDYKTTDLEKAVTDIIGEKKGSGLAKTLREELGQQVGKEVKATQFIRAVKSAVAKKEAMAGQEEPAFFAKKISAVAKEEALAGQSAVAIRPSREATAEQEEAMAGWVEDEKIFEKVTPQKLVDTKARKLSSEVAKLFGSMDEGRLDDLDEGAEFKNREEEILYKLANKYQADIEHAARQRDISEVRKLYEAYKKEYKKETSEIPGEKMPDKRPATGVSPGEVRPPEVKEPSPDAKFGEQMALFAKGKPIILTSESKDVLARVSPDLLKNIDITFARKFGPAAKYSLGAGDRGAIYRKGDRLHIVLNPALSSGEIARTLVHELMGHAGVANVLRSRPDIYKRINTIYKTQQKSEIVKKIKKEYAAELEAYPEYAEDVVFSEWIAFNMEDYVANPNKKGVSYYIWKEIRKFLNKIGVLEENIDDVMYALTKEIRTVKFVGPSYAVRPQLAKEMKAPDFYSPTEKTISELKQEKGIVPQITSMINKGQLKKAEVEWIGLEEWLKENPKATKTEVLDFVRANQVEVEDTIVGPRKKDDFKIVKDGGRYSVYRKGEDGEVAWVATRKQAEDFIHAETTRSPTKYSQYTLPGGENYKELLFKMPPDLEGIEIRKEKVPQGVLDIFIRDQKTHKYDNGYGYVGYQYGKKVTGYEYTPENVRETIKEEPKEEYRTSHWEEPNVFAHARINERTTPEGENVLFIEEIQSDWARVAREKGIVETGLNKEIKEARDESMAFEDEMLDKYGRAWWGDATNEERNKFNQLNDRELELKQRTTGVPDFPFKKNWHEFVLKRLLKYAAENGFDRIAWTTGEQQADRYDLSKQVEGIRYYTFTGELLVAKKGETTYEQLATAVKPNELDKYIGKDAAKKLRELKPDDDGGRSISGIDLKIGGEWAINLYDRMIPKFLNKYAKKWGAKTEEIEINVGDKRQLAQLERGIVPKEFEEKLLKEQLSLPITKEIKKSVLYEGQPMFAKDITKQEKKLVSPRKERLDKIYKDVGVEKKGLFKKIFKNEKSYQKVKDKIVTDIIVPISTRLKHIAPVFKEEMRRFEYNYHQNEYKDTKAVEPFIREVKKMSGEDQRILDLALKNSDIARVNGLIEKYGIEKEFEGVRNVLDKIHNRARDVGFNLNYVKEYWPRRVLNYSGLLKEVENTEEWGIIEEQILKAQEQLKRPLSEKEKAEIINFFIARPDRIVDIPGATKKRTVDIVDDKMDKYYDYSISSLIQYIHEMNQSIEIRKFLGMGLPKKGEGGADSPSLRSFGGTGEQLTLEGMKDAADDIIDNKVNDIEGGIGKYVMKAIDEHNLTPEQQDELIGILKARFDYKISGNLTQKIKDLGYITAMGSGFSSFLTQIGDLTWAYYEGGPVKATISLAKAFVGKSIVKKEELGVDRIAEEFRTARGMGKALRKIFDWTLLTKTDSIGKEALVNAALLKYQKQALKNDTKLIALLNRTFGFEEGANVLEDFKNKKITDNVKYLLFSKLLDFQPMALSEMPLAYLKSPGGRVFYMLKTFTIKQLDVFRNEGIDLITEGFKTNNKKMALKGFTNLMYLSSLFIIANAGADELKDWLFGRKPAFADKVWDNILRLVGLSRFIAWETRRAGPVAAFWKLITPPMDIIEAPLRDTWKMFTEKGKDFKVKVKNMETWKIIPFFGKHYYWWFGVGRERELKRQEKQIPSRRAGKTFGKETTTLQEKMDAYKYYKSLSREEQRKFSGNIEGFSKQYKKIKKGLFGESVWLPGQKIYVKRGGADNPGKRIWNKRTKTFETRGRSGFPARIDNLKERYKKGKIKESDYKHRLKKIEREREEFKLWLARLR